MSRNFGCVSSRRATKSRARWREMRKLIVADSAQPRVTATQPFPKPKNNPAAMPMGEPGITAVICVAAKMPAKAIISIKPGSLRLVCKDSNQWMNC